ncbi:MAG: GNAT family N-acetyltransferase [Gemmatimonadetes bacterium]|nr:GNAT family N-acetyltransferase [Gemmatimonadota bacterium]
MDWSRRPAPRRIETERMVLRPWNERSDAEALHDAVLESLDTLRPWLPWAEAEPGSLRSRRRTLRTFAETFARDEDYIYGAFTPDESRVLGGFGLHPRVGPGGIELGYWVRASETRRGYAAEGAAALITAAIRLMGLDRIEVRIEPRNVASQRVVAKLGLVKEATLRRRFPRGKELRDMDLYTVFREDPLPETSARFLDPAGREISPQP